MAAPASSSIQGMTTKIKQLKLLVIVLVLSNFGLGGLSFYLLRAIDKEYSVVIGGSVPILNSLQTLTAKAMQAMRATNPAVFGGRSENPAAFTQQAQGLFTADRDERAKALRAEWAGALAERTELQEAGANFTKAGAEVLAYYATGRLDDAVRLRESELRIAFDRYITAATKASDVLEVESSKINNHLSARAGSASSVVLGIATWPLILVAAILILTLLFLVVLMMIFRGRELGGAP